MAAQHGILLQRPAQQMSAMAGQLQELTVASGTEAPASASAIPAVAASPVPHTSMAVLHRPELFSGDSGDCRAFLTMCSLHFELNSAAFHTERSRVAYIISLLSGRAAEWATAEWRNRSPLCDTAERFTTAFQQTFQSVVPGEAAASALLRLRQGAQHVSDYAIRFRTLAADCRWEEESWTAPRTHSSWGSPGFVSTSRRSSSPRSRWLGGGRVVTRHVSLLLLFLLLGSFRCPPCLPLT